MARLIDADALIQNHCGACANKEFCAEQSCPHYEIRRRIETAPTIEPKRGTWKFGSHPDAGFLCYFCSACGHEAYWDTDYGQQRFDFCPYCGAEMLGGGAG